MGIFRETIFLLFISSIVIAKNHGMTDPHIRKAFNIMDHESVNEYEITQVYHNMSSKDNITIRLSAFGVNYTFNLKPTEGLMKSPGLLRVYTLPGNGKLEEITEGKAETGEPYCDSNNDASMIVKFYGDKNILLEGYIGRDLVIRGLRKVCVDPETKVKETDWIVDCFHIILKKSPGENIPVYNETAHTAMMQHAEAYNMNQPKWRLYDSNMVQTNNIAYVEILFIADNALYRTYGKNIAGLKSYLHSYWNDVAKNYQNLIDPSIQITLSEMIIMNENELPFISSNVHGNGKLDARATLLHMGIYIESLKNELPRHDIVVVMTGFDLYDSETYNDGTLGMANVGAACTPQFNVAIVENAEGYQAVHIVTHEIAHLLGVSHDGEESRNSRLPGSTMCNGAPNYFMTGTASSVLTKEWSPCSKNAMQTFLRSTSASCLSNKPEKEINIPDKRLRESETENDIPEKEILSDYHETCRQIGYKIAHIVQDGTNDCGYLHCCDTYKTISSKHCSKKIPVCSY